jgi:hypothetical protein
VTGTSFTNTARCGPRRRRDRHLTVAGNATLGSTSVVDIEAQSVDDDVPVRQPRSWQPERHADQRLRASERRHAHAAHVRQPHRHRVRARHLAADLNPPTCSRLRQHDQPLGGTTGNWNVDANWSRGHTPLPGDPDRRAGQPARHRSNTAPRRQAGFEDFASGGSLSLGDPGSTARSLTGGTLAGRRQRVASGPFTGPAERWAARAVPHRAGLDRDALPTTTAALEQPTNQASSPRKQRARSGDRRRRNPGQLGRRDHAAAAQGSNIKGGGALRNEGTLNMEGAERTTIKAFFTNGLTGR